jgi:NAD dependent epimerase/dehydratase family enzyme
MAVSDDRYNGVINAVTPQSISSNDFFKTLGRVLKRPQIMRAPAFAFKMLPGNMAGEIFLADNRVKPAVLEEIGYEYRFADLEEALRHQTGRYQALG